MSGCKWQGRGCPGREGALSECRLYECDLFLEPQQLSKELTAFRAELKPNLKEGTSLLLAVKDRCHVLCKAGIKGSLSFTP